MASFVDASVPPAVSELTVPFTAQELTAGLLGSGVYRAALAHVTGDTPNHESVNGGASGKRRD